MYGMLDWKTATYKKSYQNVSQHGWYRKRVISGSCFWVRLTYPCNPSYSKVWGRRTESLKTAFPNQQDFVSKQQNKTRQKEKASKRNKERKMGRESSSVLQDQFPWNKQMNKLQKDTCYMVSIIWDKIQFNSKTKLNLFFHNLIPLINTIKQTK